MTSEMITNNVIQIIEGYLLKNAEENNINVENVGIMIVPTKSGSHNMWLYKSLNPIRIISFKDILDNCKPTFTLTMLKPLISQFIGIAPEYINKFIDRYAIDNKTDRKETYFYLCVVDGNLSAFAYKEGIQTEEISVTYILS